jgi:hypothetical protein
VILQRSFGLFGCVALFALVAGCKEKPTDTAKAAACAASMWKLDQTKLNWAQQNGKDSNTVVTIDDITPLLFKGRAPVCPDGGTYTLGKVGDQTQCSIPAHNEYYKQHPDPGQ